MYKLAHNRLIFRKKVIANMHLFAKKMKKK